MLLAGIIQYPRTLLHKEYLNEFETISGNIGHITNVNFNQIILVIGTYFFPINDLSKKKHMICRIIRKLQALKVRLYAAHMNKIDDYLAVFQYYNMNNKIGNTELNKILLHSIPNGQVK